ncbi:MAG TPA: O-antigen ligase family protein [Candidatus Dormibacteraeota bacterium]|nr:O-antigen ligase family protein [Candidatus Dormibacteraeota bacterium]
MIYVPALTRRRFPYKEVGLAAAFAFGALALLAFYGSGLGVYLAILIIMVPLAICGLRWPTASAVTFIAFTPINRTVIMIAYHYSHSTLLTKGVELWKEAILGAIVARVLYDLFFTPKRNHRVLAMDIVVIIFILIGIVYVFYPGPYNVEIFARLQGFRSDNEFMLAYFAGRGLHLNRKRIEWIMWAIIPGTLLVAIIAIFQFVASDTANRVFEYFGYSDFVQFQGNIGDPIAVRNRDIPGAETLPRASSLLLGDLALSFYQVLTVSLAAALFYTSRRARELVANGVFVALMAATLVMTLSRSAIASAAGAIAVGAVAARSTGRFLVLTTIGATLIGLILLTGYIKITTVQAMVNFDDASSVKHGDQISRSIDIVLANPVGQGLATAGNIGQQLNASQSITNESWYLQIGTEMGIFGMAVYLTLVALALVLPLREFFRVRDRWLKVLTLSVAMTAGAMLVLGQFLHSWENTPLSMVFWLFAGIAVRASAIEKMPDFEKA